MGLAEMFAGGISAGAKSLAGSVGDALKTRIKEEEAEAARLQQEHLLDIQNKYAVEREDTTFNRQKTDMMDVGTGETLTQAELDAAKKDGRKIARVDENKDIVAVDKDNKPLRKRDIENGAVPAKYLTELEIEKANDQHRKTDAEISHLQAQSGREGAMAEYYKSGGRKTGLKEGQWTEEQKRSAAGAKAILNAELAAAAGDPMAMAMAQQKYDSAIEQIEASRSTKTDSTGTAPAAGASAFWKAHEDTTAAPAKEKPEAGGLASSIAPETDPKNIARAKTAVEKAKGKPEPEPTVNNEEEAKALATISAPQELKDIVANDTDADLQTKLSWLQSLAPDEIAEMAPVDLMAAWTVFKNNKRGE